MHEQWLKFHQSVLSLTFENAEGRITSGSAFKAYGLLVTNNHVVQVPNARHVHLRSMGADGNTTVLNLTFEYLEFRSMLIEGDPEDSWDYAVLKIRNSEFAAIPDLPISRSDNVGVGRNVVLFGYQFEQQNLSMHVGYISSQYQRAGVDYLQLDLSVNHGNSGGPLIDVESGEVIGIVTRKATGLTQQFYQLLQDNQQIIQLLLCIENGPFSATVPGLNPVGISLTTQQQLQTIAREIGRSANVGIGYAYHIRKVRESLEFNGSDASATVADVIKSIGCAEERSASIANDAPPASAPPIRVI